MRKFDKLVSLAEGMAQGSTENTNKFWHAFRQTIERMLKSGLRYRSIVEGGHDEDFVQQLLLYLVERNLPRLMSGEWTSREFVGYSLNRVRLMAVDYYHAELEQSPLGLSFDGVDGTNGVADLDTISQGHWVSARKVGTPEREFLKKTVRTELENVVQKMNSLGREVVQMCLIEARAPRNLPVARPEQNKLKARIRFRVRVELKRVGIEGDYLARP